MSVARTSSRWGLRGRGCWADRQLRRDERTLGDSRQNGRILLNRAKRVACKKVFGTFGPTVVVGVAGVQGAATTVRDHRCVLAVPVVNLELSAALQQLPPVCSRRPNVTSLHAPGGDE